MPELSGRRRLHGGTESASGGRVKAVSRASGGAKAPASTRAPDADTLKPRNSTLTAKTVAHPWADGREVCKRGEGLSEGDRVIVGNLQKIGPGSPVQPLPQEQTRGP
jgi:hypothetical protein